MSTDVESGSVRLTKMVRLFQPHPPYAETINYQIRFTLMRDVETEKLVQVNGSGMNGSFKLVEEKENKVSSLKDKENVSSEQLKRGDS
ncbi:hypothetical protein KIN20_008406 [Parelaphostrongylus tenuis]|uniref:H15 domain-containing protein n=1 Tax=Parelaphostrongylus tenuis TaxID=148309 RepID=A0AAD5M4T9_PARTN|nr:hypothetical protein KIN20_008406 [Parelaphostrongylus tenuis]